MRTHAFCETVTSVFDNGDDENGDVQADDDGDDKNSKDDKNGGDEDDAGDDVRS